jgi:hypothetical protein
MSAHEERGESLRYCADRLGVLHVVIDADFKPSRGVYITQCGTRIAAADAEVMRSKTAPGLLCKACRHDTPSP